jgi:hypothetical protein
VSDGVSEGVLCVVVNSVAAVPLQILQLVY